MKIDIILFGQLAEITGTKNISLQDITDTNALTQLLYHSYPSLKNHPYRIAVDNKLISENVLFEKDCIVALMPPYSGG